MAKITGMWDEDAGRHVMGACLAYVKGDETDVRLPTGNKGWAA